MKIKIGNTPHYIEIENPIQLTEIEREKIGEAVNKHNIKCSGCGKSLKNKGWICIVHRPQSAVEFNETFRAETEDKVYGSGEWELKNVWAIFLICQDTQKECATKWSVNRPR